MAIEKIWDGSSWVEVGISDTGQFFLVDGSRPLTGNVDFDGNDIDDCGDVTCDTVTARTSKITLNSNLDVNNNNLDNVASIDSGLGTLTITPVGLDINATGAVDIASGSGNDIRLDPGGSGRVDVASSIIENVSDGTGSGHAINLGQLDARLGVGTSFPGSPSDGDHFFRTDLEKLFAYDGTRWVGSDLHAIGFSRAINNITTAQYLYEGTYGGSSQFRSEPLEWDAILVVIATVAIGTVSNTDFIIRRNTTNIQTVNRTSADSVPTATVTAGNMSTSFSKGDMVQCYMDPTPGSDSINSPMCVAFFKERV